MNFQENIIFLTYFIGKKNRLSGLFMPALHRKCAVAQLKNSEFLKNTDQKHVLPISKKSIGKDEEEIVLSISVMVIAKLRKK